jgi:hypothetical protein
MAAESNLHFRDVKRFIFGQLNKNSHVYTTLALLWLKTHPFIPDPNPGGFECSLIG